MRFVFIAIITILDYVWIIFMCGASVEIKGFVPGLWFWRYSLTPMWRGVTIVGVSL